MQKISPFLWFDDQAEEAVKFYTSIFSGSKILGSTHYYGENEGVSGKPAGSVMTVAFRLCGQDFTAINGGPQFKFNPSVSFLVGCKTKEEVNYLWKSLSAGGRTLMKIGEYPFSEKYGWVQDKYGVSWQVMLLGNRKMKQKIVPTLMFTGNVSGRAEEAINYYASIFRYAKVGEVFRYGKGQEPDKEGTVMHASFILEKQEFAAMDSARPHQFTFNEAISFVVNCKDQEEIDYYWGKLIGGGDEKAQVCGWLKDKFGVSWQVSPLILTTILQDKDQAKAERAMAALLKMKKLDIAGLKRAYAGK